LQGFFCCRSPDFTAFGGIRHTFHERIILIKSGHRSKTAEAGAKVIVNYAGGKYLTRTSFSEFAREIGLDTKSFEDCREHRKLFRKVVSDFEGGVKSGVDGSPTFFINGFRYDGFGDFDNLYSALQNINRYDIESLPHH
jgi:2-hydroxychromene-2-carboxylate isomerase